MRPMPMIGELFAPLHRPVAIGVQMLLPLLVITTGAARLCGQDLQWFNDLEERAKQASLVGRYEEAQRLAAQGVATCERLYGKNDARYGAGLSVQAGVLAEAGQNEDALRVARQAVATISADADVGPYHLSTALALQNLGFAQSNLGQFTEAEATYRRALAILERTLGPTSSGVGQLLNNLGVALDEQGRYLESGELFRRALDIRIKADGGKSWPVAESAYNLGIHYVAQRRFDEALRYFDYAIKVHELVFGRTSPKVAAVLAYLAICHRMTGRNSEAEASLKEVLAILQKLDPNLNSIIQAELELAQFYVGQNRLQEVEPTLQRALKHYETHGNNSGIGEVHFQLAMVRHRQERMEQSETHWAEAEKRLRADSFSKRRLFEFYTLRAAMRNSPERRKSALADIEEALRLAEELRSQFSGSAADRAKSFEFYNQAFTLAAYIYFEAGEPAKGLAAAERGAARSLVDEMSAQRVNLLAGVPATQAQALRQELSAAETQVANLEQKLQALERQQDGSAADRVQRQKTLLSQMAAARERLVDAHIGIQNASPAYRNAVGQKFEPIALADMQEWLKSQKALMLYYSSADVGILLVTLNGESTSQIHELMLTPDQAKLLEVEVPEESKTEESFNFTPAQSDKALNALLPRLANLQRNHEATAALSTLWEVLIPKTERDALLAGKYERLIVIPSGSLGLLPFEALVTENQAEPKYFIDAGPPTTYAPSATILFKLMQRKGAAATSQRNPVLTVGGVAYGQTGETADDARGRSLLKARYGALGGQLSPLPFTATESSWVKEAFANQGIGVSELMGARATEAAFRQNAPGRTILHVACHGLADQTYGNFFGALALTRGPQGNANPQDDGFLTLAEVYELDLNSNELTILSACQTNFGPKQQGEGVWALTRGFLVAGSKRVVATNWVVDDQASATLVNYLAQYVARTQKMGEGLSYAQALQKARQGIRKDSRWRDPYYWAPFVMIGPGD